MDQIVSNHLNLKMAISLLPIGRRTLISSILHPGKENPLYNRNEKENDTNTILVKKDLIQYLPRFIQTRIR